MGFLSLRTFSIKDHQSIFHPEKDGKDRHPKVIELVYSFFCSRHTFLYRFGDYLFVEGNDTWKRSKNWQIQSHIWRFEAETKHNIAYMKCMLFCDAYTYA